MRSLCLPKKWALTQLLIRWLMSNAHLLIIITSSGFFFFLMPSSKILPQLNTLMTSLTPKRVEWWKDVRLLTFFEFVLVIIIIYNGDKEYRILFSFLHLLQIIIFLVDVVNLLSVRWPVNSFLLSILVFPFYYSNKSTKMLTIWWEDNTKTYFWTGNFSVEVAHVIYPLHPPPPKKVK